MIQIKEGDRLLLKRLNTVGFLHGVHFMNCSCKHGLTLANGTASIPPSSVAEIAALEGPAGLNQGPRSAKQDDRTFSGKDETVFPD